RLLQRIRDEQRSLVEHAYRYAPTASRSTLPSLSHSSHCELYGDAKRCCESYATTASTSSAWTSLTPIASRSARPTYAAGGMTPNAHAAVAGTSSKFALSSVTRRTEPPPRMSGIVQLSGCSSL